MRPFKALLLYVVGFLASMASIWTLLSLFPPDETWPLAILVVLALALAFAGVLVRPPAMRRCFLLSAAGGVALAMGAFNYEPGSDFVRAGYGKVQAGMSGEQVAAILGEPTNHGTATFYREGEHHSQSRPASVWRFNVWGRPYFVVIAFRNGRALWKQYIWGASRKLSVWFYNREVDGLGGPAPLEITLTEET